MRAGLLHGASAVALAASFVASPAAAQLALLHGAAHVSANGAGVPTAAVPAVPGLSTGQQTALTRQLTNAAKAQQTANLALQAQTAAQQTTAAQSGGSVPNGLAAGGLQPVANPVAAANDPTGLNTWQNATLPTETVAANGAVTVTVQQTAPQAIASWTTFNVGANTTLNFNQSQNGVAEPGWVILNRVVGQLDPTTGLVNPNLAPAPSQILGAIKAQGTVLVINQNGIIFSRTAQVNTGALIATSAEIGKPNGAAPAGLVAGQFNFTSTIAERDNQFLEQGLLGLLDSTTGSGAVFSFGEFSPLSYTTYQANSSGVVTSATQAPEPVADGAIIVQAGAQITSGSNGYILLAAPTVTNSGVLTSPQGQVSLIGADGFNFYPSTGAAASSGTPNLPNIRGLVIDTSASATSTGYAYNTSTGLIQAPDGYISLQSNTVINAGVLSASTSVSRNGFIELSADNVDLAATSVVAITPDDSGGTIPDDTTSLANFKPSQVSIGYIDSNPNDATYGQVLSSNINIQSNSLIYAPSANIYIGAQPGAIFNGASVTGSPASGSVFIGSGAVIDASGLANVSLPASTSLVTISPVTANDTADAPTTAAVLDGQTVTLDLRLSGVSADGVSWVGSPLIPAADYAQQVPVSASRLMTTGGNVVIGANAATGATTPGVVIQPGATIDIAGGWVTFAAGFVQTTELISSSGAVVPIGAADPEDTYVGVYNGFVASELRYGIATTYANPLLSGAYYERAYSQGADAGSLTIQSTNPLLQGTIYAGAFTGPLQAQAAQVGTATSTLNGDQRALQAAGSQLPAGGFIFLQGVTSAEIVDGATPTSAASLAYGAPTPSVGPNGVLTLTPADAATAASTTTMGPAILSASALSGLGLGQLSIYSSGAMTVDPGANVTLAPGGAFVGLAGRTITVDGSITAPSGSISLQTVTILPGNIATTPATAPGGYDIVVNGQLSTAGLWTNDYRGTGNGVQGAGYINGGDISLTVAAGQLAIGQPAADVATVAATQAGTAPTSTTDISGSILIDSPTSLLNVSAGGYVSSSGALNLTAKGGNITLTDPDAYFQLALYTPPPPGSADSAIRQQGSAQGFRVNGVYNAPGNPSSGTALAINPSAITSQVAIGSGAIQGYGFGGGTFALTTPYLNLADGIAPAGTNLPLNFFSTAGFSTYNITSYATDIFANTFTNGLGGYNAVLATQVLTVQNGQTLNLTQTGYSNHLTGAQTAALRALPSGGQLSGVVAPSIQPDGYDQRPVSLSLGGLIELQVDPGGLVTGAAGALLSAAQIYNMGTINLPGGALGQIEVLPSIYTATYFAPAPVGGGMNGPGVSVVSGSSLSQIFSVNADGTISENAPSVAIPTMTNGQLAATQQVYLTGALPANVGIDLAPGSVTNLAGAALVNPYAAGVANDAQVVTGTIVSGGALQTAQQNIALSVPSGNNVFGLLIGETPFTTSQPGLALVAAPGSAINLSGASATFDELTASGKYAPTLQWSSGGDLTIGSGGTITGATILAQGGAPLAAGGVLNVQGGGVVTATGFNVQPVALSAVDPVAPTPNTLSVTQIDAAGFGALVVQGHLTTSGTAPVNLTLGQGFYLEGTPGGVDNSSGVVVAGAPTVSVAGALQINAPYISLYGTGQTAVPTGATVTGTGAVVFNAQALDVTGGVLFDQNVANVTLQSAGDLRLIGVPPIQQGNQAVTPSLSGQLAVTGNLNLIAGQVYATTGSSFAVTAAGATSTITISPSGATTPAPPYSAGSNLLIQAANIVQNGDLLAPVGTLTLGSTTATNSAPATTSLTLGAGSITSVSANGLSIPYGTTTDQIEYYFAPTTANPLTAPPAATLTLAAQSITATMGATVNLSGGGDLFAYEFLPGAGGSRDILNQFNSDVFTSNNGYQFPGGAQVYAIVPGLSNAAVAAYDPLYSANYGALYSPSQAGTRVYLNGGKGIAAGWYTLLPAQYAELPGGMEIVQDTTAKSAPVGASTVLNDGTVTVTGEFGGLGGAVQSTPVAFYVKNQSVISEYSQIALTSANAYFTNLASANGRVAPRLPQDAGRLIIDPTVSLILSGMFDTTPATGGRGSEVDITGTNLEVVSALGPITAGVIQLSADQLSGLNADSLLIGGVRTDNADGTTTIDVTASQVTVANNAANPLSAPDIVLAVDDGATPTLASGLTLMAGATLIATGADTTGQTGNYVINGAATGQTGQGALLRVSAGPQRLVTVEGQNATAPGGVLGVDAATLDGNSVLLDATGAISLAPSTRFAAANIGLSTNDISFAPSAQGIAGLVITPSLLTSFNAAQTLTLASAAPISFAPGAYSFGALSLNAPGLAVAGGTGTVAINAGGAVTVANPGADAGACAAAGALACGAGVFDLIAKSLTFGDGTFRIYGASQGVTLSAPGGVFIQGEGALDVGAAPLTIQTAYLGDQQGKVTAGTPSELPSLAITTAEALTLSNPTGPPTPTVIGAPGANLTLSGQSISVTGVDVRATAGVLTLTSAAGITVGAGATLETPGYSESFGDTTDPYSIPAPGGLLTLTAASGNITLASGSTLSVGGGVGNAGSLTLNAAAGTVSFGGTLSATAPSGGGGFTLNEAGAFDLAGFETATAGAFNGALAIQTGTGNLVLNAGQMLTAANVSLTANAGLVDIAGEINANGVNGGDVGLYGTSGVTLEGTALITARASGYGANNPTQAQGGQVTLGTSGSGPITMAAGVMIDVGADQTTARAVETKENGVVNYEYVPADVGGTVTFRAPVSGGDGAETVNVNIAGAVTGASSIVLEGYKAYDLGQVYDSAQFTGVTITVDPTTGIHTATLDTTAAGNNNFLAGSAPGTLVDFIQNFNVTASYANLGSLASQVNFHAQPGVELDYSGAITLASNWNLGAGTVNIPGAVAAGLMAIDRPLSTANNTVYAVLPGDEAAVFSNYTNLTYRVGGSVTGEPGDLTIKAGGQLNIGQNSPGAVTTGSITDGFFTFGDQTNPTYLNNVLGIGNNSYNVVLPTSCTAACTTVGAYSPTATNTVTFSFPATLSQSTEMEVAAGVNMIPYSAAANSPGALGSGAGGAGDPIGSAEIFPLVTTPNGATQAVSSWSYHLTAGAQAGSANPSAVVAGAKAGLTVQGSSAYTYGGHTATNTLSDTLLFSIGGADVTATQWLSAELAANPTLDDNSATQLSFNLAPAADRPLLEALAVSYFAAHPGQYSFTGPATTPTAAVTTSLSLASGFLQAVSADWAALAANYRPPNSASAASETATVATLIRTGTGSISLAAPGTIDLENGSPIYVNPITGKTSPTDLSGDYQLGGVAIYTAGQLVVPTTVTATDTTTGALVTLNPAAYATVAGNDGVVSYDYGSGSSATPGVKGAPGILVGNPVYADDGGDISITAGGSVLGRRNAGEGISGPLLGDDWVGSANTPWLATVFSAGGTVNQLINPQLFTEGVGTLAGGNVKVAAGGDVSDLSVVATTSLTTAAATGPGVAAGSSSLALLTYGGGNVSITAAGNLLGGRIDVGSGVAYVAVGGGIESAGTVTLLSSGSQGATQSNTLLLSLTNANISLTALGGAEIQGVTNMQGSGVSNGAESVDSLGFYLATSGVSVIANGTVSFDNTGSALVADSGAAGFVDDFTPTAIYPGSLQAVSIAGNLNLAGGAKEDLLTPSASGTLTLAAGANITAVNLSMLDNDPGLTPGLFSTVQTSISTNEIGGGIPFAFPAVLPNTTYAQLEQQHDSSILHLNDPTPNRIYAGGDIANVILSVPKQTRIGAGRDIVDMMFFGQNINPTDVTRIVAGRDITATTVLAPAVIGFGDVSSSEEPTVQGDSFVIGGPGSFWLEAGRNLGPFLTSVTTTEFTSEGSVGSSVTETFGGGVISVGNSWDPYLSSQGASLFVGFGVSKGQDFSALLNYYLDPANTASLPDYLFPETLNANNVYVPDRSAPIYNAQLIAYMQANETAALIAAYGTTNVTYAQAYSVFAALPPLQQDPFLLQIYYSELSLTSTPGPTFHNYTRGYTAVNLLFPSSYGYTANNLSGGTNGANTLVSTGNLDLRLATIQTQYGGNIDILAPGGEVLAGSTVATAQQAARRNAADLLLYNGDDTNLLSIGVENPIASTVSSIGSIPASYEGILTLRGGNISTFTDTSFTLNQSRLFTEEGGNIIMWSSNGNLDAGEGPKTTSDFPPIQVLIDNDAFSQVNASSDVTGAGIGAFQPSPDIQAPDVYLIAPRGTVNAGAAGVRVAGDLFVAALQVENADNFKVGGTAIGLPPTNTTVEVGQQSSNAAAAATKAAQNIVAGTQAADNQTAITVEVLGFGDPS
jgi:filamentous hemagglutinin family protein